MILRNTSIANLAANYLFAEIANRKNNLLKQNPKAELINLGIGDTTKPIPSLVITSFIQKAQELGTMKGYTGYGDAFGNQNLRDKIANAFYPHLINSEDIFISDGAKCDLGRLQLLFGEKTVFAVQDPSYPVYIGTSVMTGKAKEFNPQSGQYEGIVYMPCTAENNFLPDLGKAKEADVICLCSPNNPTGVAFSKKQLKEIVDFSKENQKLIIFDAAYSGFIQNPNCPKTIYEVDGADEVAIEINSFSKLAGFTGVRLGWSVIPKKLKFIDGTPIQSDWIKIITTFFNGPSNLAEAGGSALLSKEGLKESNNLCLYYLQNAKILKSALEEKGYSVYGGENAPYLWAYMGQSSWDLFDHLLNKAHLITTPGVGFGPTGEGYLRFSAFGENQVIEEAAQRIKKAL